MKTKAKELQVVKASIALTPFTNKIVIEYMERNDCSKSRAIQDIIRFYETTLHIEAQ